MNWHLFFHSETLFLQFISVLSAFVLCMLLGVERQFHQKNAGVKTHVLVGVGSCIFTLVSAYGFGPVLGSDVHLDPSRIAAQIVSGIGFLGAGVIFVNNDTVRGLTTAATVWLSAAIGMACGAFMLPLAIFVVFMHYILVFVVGPLLNRLPGRRRAEKVIIEYHTGLGVMRHIMLVATQLGFKASVLSSTSINLEEVNGLRVVMRFEGNPHLDELYAELRGIEGIFAVDTEENQRID